MLGFSVCFFLTLLNYLKFLVLYKKSHICKICLLNTLFCLYNVASKHVLSELSSSHSSNKKTQKKCFLYFILQFKAIRKKKANIYISHILEGIMRAQETWFSILLINFTFNIFFQTNKDPLFSFM